MMTETNVPKRTTLIGWIVVGWLLSLIVVLLWILTDAVTIFVFIISIGLGIGIAVILILNETLILTMIQTLQKTGESVVQTLNLRKNMRVVLTIWIMGLFTLVIVMTALNQLALDKFNVIMGVLGSFVASIVAFYFATGKSEATS